MLTVRCSSFEGGTRQCHVDSTRLSALHRGLSLLLATMCTQTERAHSQPQLGQAFNSAASLLSPLFNCCQVGQRLLVPTHVFGDEAVACDRQARPCAGQRCSLCGDLVGLGLISGLLPLHASLPPVSRVSGLTTVGHAITATQCTFTRRPPTSSLTVS